VEVVASLSQGRTAAAQCGLFPYKSVPVIFEPPCRMSDPDLIEEYAINVYVKLFVFLNSYVLHTL